MNGQRSRTTALQLDAKRIGDRVRHARKRRGLSQVKLAAITGVDDSVIALIEQGRRLPSRDAGIGIAVGLRRSLEWLYFDLAKRGTLHGLAEGNGRARSGRKKCTLPGPRSPGRAPL